MREAGMQGIGHLAAADTSQTASERYPGMIPVSSSMMTAVGYDTRARTLAIRFREGGCYRYAQVPRRVFDALLAAPSKGAFFHAEIDGRYRYVRED